MSDLVLFRHSEAEAVQSTDFERRLTEQGRFTLQKIAETALSVVPTLDTILSSPLIRARQSAEILAQAYGLSSDSIQECDELANGMPAELLRILKPFSGSNIACVGHMPGLSFLASDLAAGYQVPLDFNFFPGQFLVFGFSGKFLRNQGHLRYRCTLS